MRTSLPTLPTLFTFGILAMVAPAMASQANPTPEEKPKAESKEEDPSQGAFWDLTPEAAFIEAAKQNKISILFMLRPDEDTSKRTLSIVLKNPKLLSWIKDNAVAIKVIQGVNDDWIKRKGVIRFPTVSIRTANRRILDIAHGYRNAEEWLTLFQTAKRTASANSRPEGDAAQDPYSWMAYGSYLFGSAGDPDEVGNAFLWCLDNANDKDPAFLEKHINFLLRKLVQVGKLSPNVQQGVQLRRDALHDKVLSGKASHFEAFALSRFGIFLRDMDDAIRAFHQIKPDTEHKKTLKSILMWSNLERMVAYRRYHDLLGHLPNPLPTFEARMAAVIALENGIAVTQESDIPRPPEQGADLSKDKESKIKPEAPLHGIVQTRPAMIIDAALFYECLIAVNRADDAEALMIKVTDFEPTGQTYARFIERSNRLKKMKISNAVADRGAERVPEDQIWRIRNMIARGTRGINR